MQVSGPSFLKGEKMKKHQSLGYTPSRRKFESGFVHGPDLLPIIVIIALCMGLTFSGFNRYYVHSKIKVIADTLGDKNREGYEDGKFDDNDKKELSIALGNPEKKCDKFSQDKLIKLIFQQPGNLRRFLIFTAVITFITLISCIFASRWDILLIPLLVITPMFLCYIALFGYFLDSTLHIDPEIVFSIILAVIVLGIAIFIFQAFSFGRDYNAHQKMKEGKIDLSTRKGMREQQRALRHDRKSKEEYRKNAIEILSEHIKGSSKEEINNALQGIEIQSLYSHSFNPREYSSLQEFLDEVNKSKETKQEEA
jgi:ABC-type multidrug transport system fused ATPase/permease subunit